MQPQSLENKNNYPLEIDINWQRVLYISRPDTVSHGYKDFGRFVKGMQTIIKDRESENLQKAGSTIFWQINDYKSITKSFFSSRIDCVFTMGTNS